MQTFSAPATPMPAAAALQRLPLPEPKARQLMSLAEELDGASLWWLSGYTAGLAQRAAAPAPAESRTATAVEPEAQLSIVYGSQTGNARRVAEQLARQAESAGLGVRLQRADTYPVRELAKERLLYVVISTQGDGDPPDDARGFVDFLGSRRAPELKALSYAVLGLGDSSYPQFCVIGRKLDERLAQLGANRLVDFGATDLDIETVAGPWLRQALERAQDALQARTTPANVTPLRPHAEAVESAWSQARPFSAEVLANQRITSDGSSKDVRHLELDVSGAGFDYEPGDVLAVVPHNPPELVAAALATLQLDGDANVTHAGATRPLREWLGSQRELTRVARPFVAALAARGGHTALRTLLQPDQGEALRALLATQQPLDLLRDYPVDWSGEQLVAALRPLAPRLYSIASSREVVGDEVHLTLAHVEYATAAGTRWGAASHWLATRQEGDAVAVYLERNERFRLPAEPDRDVIMIGPGTGVAPFRAFVQQRAQAHGRGRNWLVFGNPNFRSDFLYQVEWQAALAAGSLHHLDLAFSRDQSEKIYVQDRLREQARDLYDWLESGAHLYVCGATAMARDVEAALHAAIVKYGARSGAAADQYLADLRAAHRYARDVY